jgi:proteasome activator subunit 4
MIPVMTSFLPPTHTHLYLPAIFKIWEAFNSMLLDERLIEFVGELAEEHIAGVAGNAGLEGGARWKDVGMWSEAEWTVLMSKALGSMSTYIQHGDALDLYVVVQMCQWEQRGYVR